MEKTKCYICNKEINPDEILYEIIVMREGKNILQSILRKMFANVDVFVCEECINNGITYQLQFKKFKKVNNGKRK